MVGFFLNKFVYNSFRYKIGTVCRKMFSIFNKCDLIFITYMQIKNIFSILGKTEFIGINQILVKNQYLEIDFE